MSDARASTSLDCECGHSERLHTWTSVELAGLMMTGSCAYRERLPREGQEANVRFKFCECRKYRPKKTPDPTGGFLPR